MKDTKIVIKRIAKVELSLGVIAFYIRDMDNKTYQYTYDYSEQNHDVHASDLVALSLAREGDMIQGSVHILGGRNLDSPDRISHIKIMD